MWPFTRPTDDIDAAVADAIPLAAERWRAFGETSGLAPNIHLRDRIAFFAADFRPVLYAAFPLLADAPPELLLLIIAEGIAASGSHSREQIELQLGIVLPR
jgi:hypothetical protein